jgi:hypothetical protein
MLSVRRPIEVVELNCCVTETNEVIEVLLDRDHALIDGAGEKKDIEARIAQIKAQIEDTTSDYDSHEEDRPLSASLTRIKRLTDIKQAAMHINPASKTSQRSCCKASIYAGYC